MINKNIENKIVKEKFLNLFNKKYILRTFNKMMLKILRKIKKFILKFYKLKIKNS